MSLPEGWYAVEVRVWDINAGAALSYTYRQKFGVGDVYVIAGQSNAQGYPENGGSWSLPSISAFDGVVSHNYWGPCNASLPPYPSMSPLSGYNRIAPSGNNSWNWAKTGQQLSGGSSTVPGKPIAYFNAAAGGSSALNWYESSQGTNTDNVYTPGTSQWCESGYLGPAQPYYDFKTTLKYYSSIFGTKAVLWHQGETDNDKGKSIQTSTNDYRTRLLGVISKSRTDFSSSLRWLVSEVSFQGKNPSSGGTTTLASVIAGQQEAINSTYDPSNFGYQGALTDAYGTGYRDVTDMVHFREDRTSALTTVAGVWNTKIAAPTTYANIGAATPPTVTMSKSGSTWSLSVSGVYSEYRWLNMWSPDPNSPVGTGSTLTGSSSFGAWACLVKNSSGNWAISQTFYTSCGVCREGSESTSEWSEKDLGIETKAYPMPFEKDVTIEFTIPFQTKVRLELLSVDGKVISKIADNVHAKGTYKYPINNRYLKSGALLYRLDVNGLAITKKLVKVD